ncbi:MAG: hypothetical protein J0L62_02505 [Bacteroidetes bacterium]|nr:hypothetical protein [Bacteroidota bacterium]
MKIPVLILFTLISFQVIQAQVNQDENLSKLAEHYFSVKDFSQALPLFEDLHSRNPEIDFFFDRHWSCLYQLGRYNEAHKVLKSKFIKSNDLSLLDEMARISVLTGEPLRAESEWKQLLEGFNYNQNVVRSVGITMSGLRRYDLAKALYLSQRKPTDPYAFNQELIQIYTQTIDAQGAATEFLLFLKQRPDQDGFVESRIVQYFSDSLLSSKMLAVFENQDSASLPPSILRIKGTLAKQSGKFDLAFSFTSRYDAFLKNGGSTSFYLVNSLSQQDDREVVIRLAERFNVVFPASQFRGQTELKLVSCYADGVWFNIDNLGKIEKVYQRQTNERDAGLIRDVYLKAILKSQDTPSRKKTRIENLLASSRVGNRQYWDWVLAVLDADFNWAQKSFSNQAFKTNNKWEFILTSLALNTPIDSLRSSLFSFARDLKSTETPKFLYLLIQSVPVPAFNFNEFSGIAKATIFHQLGLFVQASEQYRIAQEAATDSVVRAIAANEYWLVQLEMENELEILNLSARLTSNPAGLIGLDESVFKTGVFFYKRGNLMKAQELFELIVREAPVSAYTAMARDYLNEIRKRNS